MGGQVVRRRAEVVGPYRRPLRYVVATAWRTEPQLRWRARLFAAFAITTAAGAVAGSLAVRAIGVFGLFIGGFALIPWVTEIASRTLRLRRAWRRRTELRDVLRRRPQAGSEDPDL